MESTRKVGVFGPDRAGKVISRWQLLYLAHYQRLSEFFAGKSCLISRLCGEEFRREYNRTVHATSKTLTLPSYQNPKDTTPCTITEYPHSVVRDSLDTIFSLEKFACIILCFNLASQESFAQICNVFLPKILVYIRRGVPVILVGCGSDQVSTRQIQVTEGVAQASANNCAYLEASALDGNNIESLLNMVKLRASSTVTAMGTNQPKHVTQIQPRSAQLASNAKASSQHVLIDSLRAANPPQSATTILSTTTSGQNVHTTPYVPDSTNHSPYNNTWASGIFKDVPSSSSRLGPFSHQPSERKSPNNTTNYLSSRRSSIQSTLEEVMQPNLKTILPRVPALYNDKGSVATSSLTNAKVAESAEARIPSYKPLSHNNSPTSLAKPERPLRRGIVGSASHFSNENTTIPISHAVDVQQMNQIPMQGHDKGDLVPLKRLEDDLAFISKLQSDIITRFPKPHVQYEPSDATSTLLGVQSLHEQAISDSNAIHDNSNQMFFTKSIDQPSRDTDYQPLIESDQPAPAFEDAYSNLQSLLSELGISSAASGPTSSAAPSSIEQVWHPQEMQQPAQAGLVYSTQSHSAMNEERVQGRVAHSSADSDMSKGNTESRYSPIQSGVNAGFTPAFAASYGNSTTPWTYEARPVMSHEGIQIQSAPATQPSMHSASEKIPRKSTISNSVPKAASHSSHSAHTCLHSVSFTQTTDMDSSNPAHLSASSLLESDPPSIPTKLMSFSPQKKRDRIKPSLPPQATMTSRSASSAAVYAEPSAQPHSLQNVQHVGLPTNTQSHKNLPQSPNALRKSQKNVTPMSPSGQVAPVPVNVIVHAPIYIGGLSMGYLDIPYGETKPPQVNIRASKFCTDHNISYAYVPQIITCITQTAEGVAAANTYISSQKRSSSSPNFTDSAKISNETKDAAISGFSNLFSKPRNDLLTSSGGPVHSQPSASESKKNLSQVESSRHLDKRNVELLRTTQREKEELKQMRDQHSTNWMRAKAMNIIGTYVGRMHVQTSTGNRATLNISVDDDPVEIVKAFILAQSIHDTTLEHSLMQAVSSQQTKFLDSYQEKLANQQYIAPSSLGQPTMSQVNSLSPNVTAALVTGYEPLREDSPLAVHDLLPAPVTMRSPFRSRARHSSARNRDRSVRGRDMFAMLFSTSMDDVTDIESAPPSKLPIRRHSTASRYNHVPEPSHTSRFIHPSPSKGTTSPTQLLPTNAYKEFVNPWTDVLIPEQPYTPPAKASEPSRLRTPEPASQSIWQSVWQDASNVRSVSRGHSQHRMDHTQSTMTVVVAHSNSPVSEILQNANRQNSNAASQFQQSSKNAPFRDTRPHSKPRNTQARRFSDTPDASLTESIPAMQSQPPRRVIELKAGMSPSRAQKPQLTSLSGDVSFDSSKPEPSNDYLPALTSIESSTLSFEPPSSTQPASFIITGHSSKLIGSLESQVQNDRAPGQILVPQKSQSHADQKTLPQKEVNGAIKKLPEEKPIATLSTRQQELLMATLSRARSNSNVQTSDKSSIQTETTSLQKVGSAENLPSQSERATVSSPVAPTTPETPDTPDTVLSSGSENDVTSPEGISSFHPASALSESIRGNGLFTHPSNGIIPGNAFFSGHGKINNAIGSDYAQFDRRVGVNSGSTTTNGKPKSPMESSGDILSSFAPFQLKIDVGKGKQVSVIVHPQTNPALLAEEIVRDHDLPLRWMQRVQTVLEKTITAQVAKHRK